MAKWEVLPKGLTVAAEPVLSFARSRASLVADYGPPQFEDEDTNGVGLADCWCLRFECGLEVGLEWLQDFARMTGRPDGAECVNVYADPAEVEHARFHLGLVADEVDLWVRAERVEVVKGWAVIRQDDNGNQFTVESFSSECEAVEEAERLDQGMHKQTYWAKRVSDPVAERST